MGARVVTVNEVLGGHVRLDIECLDRVYLNAYVPILQSSGQVVAFMTQHLGLPIPSPASRHGLLPCRRSFLAKTWQTIWAQPSVPSCW